MGLVAEAAEAAGMTPSPRAREVYVATAAELVRELESGPGARIVRLRPGVYVFDAPLFVPEGVELVGDGVMNLDSQGVPVAWGPHAAASIVATPGLHGDLVTLGAGTRLRGLRIEGAPEGRDRREAASGNVVVVAASEPRAYLDVQLQDCEVVNHDRFGVGPKGPTGRAVVVVTRNAGASPAAGERAAAGDRPDPRDGMRVSVRIERSIVRNTASSNSLFVVNFASASSITVELEQNHFEGVLTAAGGASGVETVERSSVAVRSRGNLYVNSVEPHHAGWQIIGGSLSPHDLHTKRAARSNDVRIDSRGDRISGFHIGILAAAGRMTNGQPGSVTDNRGDLRFERLTIQTVGESAADLSLHGSLIESGTSSPAADAAVEEKPRDNVLQVTIAASSGSGPRSNLYADATPPLGHVTGSESLGNRIEFGSTADEFARSNPSLVPAPPERLFRRASVLPSR